MSQKRIVIAGGSGFIGRALTWEFLAQDREVLILTRNLRVSGSGAREVLWDGEHNGEWEQSLEGAEAVINLSGKSIDCRHTPANLREIVASRVKPVNALGAAILKSTAPPRVWVQSSATGYYGDTRDRIFDESSPNGSDTLAQVCREWESTFEALPLPETRRVIVRIGFVLGRESGALPVLSRLTKWFLGGSVGDGRQFISWIHLKDLVRMFVRLVEDQSLAGTFNAVVPEPVTNAVFMRELRQAWHRPWSPPAPEFAVKFGARLMGSEPSLALASQRCVPKRFLRAGFEYQFPTLAPALHDLCTPI